MHRLSVHQYGLQLYEYLYVVSINSRGGGESLFLLVGHEDNTNITIVPTQTIEVQEDSQNPSIPITTISMLAIPIIMISLHYI